MRVTFQDCRRELLDRGGRPTLRAFDEWRTRTGYQKVVAFATTFSHQYLFSIPHSEILAVMERSEHALGDVRKEEQLQEVENFTCPFAFQHLFHKYLETEQRVPTWQEFRSWLNGPAAAFYVTPLLASVGWDQAGPQRKRVLRRAFRWRVGKFYYSAMRELELLARLRAQYNIVAKYHVVADVLLRVDFWLESTLVRTYSPNELYFDGREGRKLSTERLFSEAEPRFRVVDVKIKHQGFGTFWIANDASVADLAAALHN